MAIRGWLPIALASAFGALIGSLASMEIAARFGLVGQYIWGSGALGGGVAAYVAIDFRHLCAGVADSYRRTIAWKPCGLWWRAFGSAFVASAGIIPTMLAGVGVLILIILIASILDHRVPSYTLVDALIYGPLVFIGLSIVAVSSIGLLLGLATTGRGKDTPEEYVKNLNVIIAANWSIWRTGNLATVTIWLVRHALQGLRYSAGRAPQAAVKVCKGAKLLSKFVADVFIYVHSQRRTICFVDATLGAAIGYTLGSAIVGALAGGILGAISYELVSVRWLGIAPARITR